MSLIVRLNISSARSLTILICGSFAVSQVHADTTVYRCTNADGKVEFTDVAKKGCRAFDLPTAQQGALPHAQRGQRLDIAEAKHIVERRMRDPESTRYRNLFMSASGDVCGAMNSKNAYGGYAGYVDFIVDAKDRKVLIVADIGWDSFIDAFRSRCLSRKIGH